jgi:O-antigen ligase
LVAVLFAPRLLSFALPDDRLGGAGFVCLASSLLLATALDGWPSATRLALVGIVTAGCVLVLSREAAVRGLRPQLLEVVSWIAAMISAVGLVGVAFHAAPFGMEATGLWRASSTLTYANALGALLVLCLPAALLQEMDRPGPSGRLITFAILAGIFASLSRGAIFGLVLMVATLLWLGAGDLVRGMGRTVTGSLIAFGGLLPSIAGNRPAPVPALLGMGLGGVVAILPRGSDQRADGRRVAAVAVAAILASAALLASGYGSRLAASRIDFGREGRPESWRQALRAGSAAPIFGIGPGNLRIIVRAGRKNPLATGYAHNEYLQTFAETGTVGLIGVLSALGLFAAWAVRRRPGGASSKQERVVWAAAVAACAAFAAQSGTDLIWRFPVLIAIAFLWLGLAVAPPAFGGRGVES